ncbi:MAG: YlxR family protein [Synergistaceae bacterium]|nr:YlxR family protein [Synergistaceae bacterium]
MRVVKITEGGESSIKFDLGGKLQGRGAWVCRKIECIEKAKKSRAFERMLKTRAAEEVYEELLSCAM